MIKLHCQIVLSLYVKLLVKERYVGSKVVSHQSPTLSNTKKKVKNYYMQDVIWVLLGQLNKFLDILKTE